MVKRPAMANGGPRRCGRGPSHSGGLVRRPHFRSARGAGCRCVIASRRAADAALDQAGALYRSAVLTAFQNVADALHALDTDADALNAASRAEAAAQKSLDVARRQLELGSVSYLALVTAEQTYQQAVISLTQARTNRYTDTAALFQALGGSVSPIAAAH
jgi:outer membrane protein TolC